MDKKLSRISSIIITQVLKSQKLIPIQLAQCYLYSALPNKRFIYSNIEGAFCLVISTQTKTVHILIIDTNNLDTNFDAEFEENFSSAFAKLSSNFYTLNLTQQLLGFYFPQKEDADKIFDFIKAAKPEKINTVVASYEQEEKKNFMKKLNFEKIGKLIKENMKKNNEQQSKYSSAVTPKNFQNKEINFAIFNYPLMKKFAWNESKKKFEFYEGKNTQNILTQLKINFEEVEVAKENILMVKNLEHVVDLLVSHFVNELVLAKDLLNSKILYLEERQLKKKYENEIKKQFEQTNTPAST